MRAWSEQAARLKSLLRRHGATHHDAEDLVQEAFLRLHQYLQTGAEVRQPHSFLVRTALNLAIDGTRFRTRHPVETLDKAALLDISPSLEEAFEVGQRLKAITHMLDTKVSRRARDIYYLHRIEGYTHTEIAERMNVSVRTVEKDIARVLTQLWMESPQP